MQTLQAVEDSVISSRVAFNDSGILLVDKPSGMTSMDVIRQIRKIVRAKRIGHGGTLDPFATGLLPLLFNQATRFSNQIMSGDKEYLGVFHLGLSFDTQDITGKPLHEEKPLTTECHLEGLQSLCRRFIGRILQRPPAYSAIKRQGQPLYKYARAGETIEVEPREVFVEAFEILGQVSDRDFQFRVACAKGVYVRTLVHDLGQALGTGAVVTELRRTRVGDYQLEEAVRLNTLQLPSDIQLHLRPIHAVLGQQKRYLA